MFWADPTIPRCVGDARHPHWTRCDVISGRTIFDRLWQRRLALAVFGGTRSRFYHDLITRPARKALHPARDLGAGIDYREAFSPCRHRTGGYQACFEIAQKEEVAKLFRHSEGEVDGPTGPHRPHSCEVRYRPGKKKKKIPASLACCLHTVDAFASPSTRCGDGRCMAASPKSSARRL